MLNNMEDPGPLLVRWRNESMSRVDSRAPVLSVDARLARLTAREREILALLAAAPQNRETATQLEISASTATRRASLKSSSVTSWRKVRLNFPGG